MDVNICSVALGLKISVQIVNLFYNYHWAKNHSWCNLHRNLWPTKSQISLHCKKFMTEFSFKTEYVHYKQPKSILKFWKTYRNHLSKLKTEKSSSMLELHWLIIIFGGLLNLKLVQMNSTHFYRQRNKSPNDSISV